MFLLFSLACMFLFLEFFIGVEVGCEFVTGESILKIEKGLRDGIVGVFIFGKIVVFFCFFEWR